MAKIPQSGGGFELHPEGEGEGVFLGYFDHGMEDHPKWGEKWKIAAKVMSTSHAYEYTHEDKSGKEVTETRPFILSQKMNMATGDRSDLAKFRKRMLGRKLTGNENDDVMLVTEDDSESQGVSVRYEVVHNAWKSPQGDEMTFANIDYIKVVDDKRSITDEEKDLVTRVQEAIYKRIEEAEKEVKEGGGDDEGDEERDGDDTDYMVVAAKWIEFLSEADVYSNEKVENYTAFIKTAEKSSLKKFITRCEKHCKEAGLTIPEFDDLPF